MQDEPSAMDRLLEARRRYAALRDALPCDCALDLDLRDELSRAIRMLDAKIAGIDPDEPPPCALSPGGRSARGRAPARRRRSAP
jgi:hypothetical protein